MNASRPRARDPCVLSERGRREQLLARQPFAELIELAAAIVRDRLQRQMMDLGGAQGHFGRAARRGLDGVGVGVEVEEAEQRHLVEIAEAVEETAAQLLQGPPAEAADADDERGPQRAGLRLGDGHAQPGDLVAFAAGRSVEDSTRRSARPRPACCSSSMFSIVSAMDLGRLPSSRRRRRAASAGRDGVRAVYRARTKARQLGKRLAGSFDRRGRRRPFAFRQRPQLRLLVHVLLGQLPRVLAVERPLAGEQFLIDDGQAVLIAAAADRAGEGLRRRVQRRDAAQDAGGAGALQVLDQAEVGHLDAIADEEQVARLDVEMLQVVLLVHVIERFGRVADVAQQRVARDADQAGRACIPEADRAGSCRPAP